MNTSYCCFLLYYIRYPALSEMIIQTSVCQLFIHVKIVQFVVAFWYFIIPVGNSDGNALEFSKTNSFVKRTKQKIISTHKATSHTKKNLN